MVLPMVLTGGGLAFPPVEAREYEMYKTLDQLLHSSHQPPPLPPPPFFQGTEGKRERWRRPTAFTGRAASSNHGSQSGAFSLSSSSLPPFPRLGAKGKREV